MKEEISHYHETIGEALQVFCTLPMDEDDNCWRSSADVEGNVAL